MQSAEQRKCSILCAFLYERFFPRELYSPDITAFPKDSALNWSKGSKIQDRSACRNRENSIFLRISSETLFSLWIVFCWYQRFLKEKCRKLVFIGKISYTDGAKGFCENMPKISRRMPGRLSCMKKGFSPFFPSFPVPRKNWALWSQLLQNGSFVVLSVEKWNHPSSHELFVWLFCSLRRFSKGVALCKSI